MYRRYETPLAWRTAPWIAVAAVACLMARPGWSQQGDDPVPAPPSAQETEPPQPPRQPQPPAAEHREHSLDRFDQAGTTPDEVTMSHTGEFIRAQGNRFTMRSQDREHSHSLSEDSRVTLNGRPARLSDLQPGDRIAVTSSKTELGTALAVRATRGASNQEQAHADAQAGRNAEPQPEQANRGALGVLLGETPDGQGVIIRDVAPNSSAARAGIRPGDHIVSIENQPIASPDDVLRTMAQKNAGEQAALEIRRNGRTMNVAVTLGAQRDLAFRQQGEPGQSDRGDEPRAQQGSQAWLGIMLRDDRQARPPGEAPAEHEAPQKGAVIANVYPSGPAARAGLMSGDVIVRLGEHEINQLDDLYQAMDRLQPREPVEITVLRNGEEQQITATLASREDFFGEQPLRFRDEFFGGDFPAQRDPFGGAPEHSMMLEQQRHLATQHQRLEDLLQDVLEEVKQLRQEVQELKSGETRRDNP
jgi:hypothetical protein